MFGKDLVNDILSRGRTDGSEVYTERIGAWDCPACDLVGVRGFVKSCPSCGHNKDAATEAAEYLPENALYYTKGDMNELLGMSENPDWICDHCNTCISDIEATCTHCGGPKGSVKTQVIEYKADNAPKSSKEAKDQSRAWKPSEPIGEHFAPTIVSEIQPSIIDRITGNATYLILGLVGILAIFGIYWLLFATYTVKGRVQGFEWHREIRIEKLNTVYEEGWSVPSEGREISSRQEIKSYNKVITRYDTKTKTETYQSSTTSYSYKCGTTKTGKGTYSDKYCTGTKPVYSTRTVSYQEPVYKDVPIYATKYKYEIDRWQHERTVPKNGTDKIPIWPAFSLGFKEREAGRAESYKVILVDNKGSVHTISYNEAKWKSITIDKTCVMTFNNIGMLVNTDL